MVILDPYVNYILSYIVAKRLAAVFVRIGYVFKVRMFLHHVQSETGVQSCQTFCPTVRISSTVHKQENIVWTQVEKDINTGVFILRTVDSIVWPIKNGIYILVEVSFILVPARWST